MISEWWRSWTFDLARKTGFERLEAQYDIKKGVMRSSPDLAMNGSEVEITSTGSVNVPARRFASPVSRKSRYASFFGEEPSYSPVMSYAPTQRYGD